MILQVQTQHIVGMLTKEHGGFINMQDTGKQGRKEKATVGMCCFLAKKLQMGSIILLSNNHEEFLHVCAG